MIQIQIVITHLFFEGLTWYLRWGERKERGEDIEPIRAQSMLHCAHVPDNLEEDNVTLPMTLQKVAFDHRETSHEPPRKRARLPLTGANRFYQCFVVHTRLTTGKRTMRRFQCQCKRWRLTIERHCANHPESMLAFNSLVPTTFIFWLYLSLIEYWIAPI